MPLELTTEDPQKWVFKTYLKTSFLLLLQKQVDQKALKSTHNFLSQETKLSQGQTNTYTSIRSLSFAWTNC